MSPTIRADSSRQHAQDSTRVEWIERIVGAGWVLLFLATPIMVVAEEATLEQRVQFNILRQRADTALTQFAEQANLTLLFPFDGVREQMANELVGEYTLDEAIESLLAGTNLTPTFKSQLVLDIAIEEDLKEGDDMNVTKKAGFLAGLAAVFTGANAQEPVSTNETDEKEEVLEQIIVTGSRIRGAQSASPLVTITRQEIDQAGFATVEDIVEKLPQNFSAGATLDRVLGVSVPADLVSSVDGNVSAFAGGTSVNLRGLGASSTLILLNGRRLSPGGGLAKFTNISSIPVSAIERVEVMTDGASAIYGSDAIGGVVNFILREDFEGAETRVRYGTDARGGTSSILFGQSFGGSWDSGNALLTYEYYDSDNLANADRDITSTNDLTRFGGTDRRRLGGNPANIVAGGQTFAIPSGQDGTSLTAADFDPNAPLNFHNNRSIGDILPAQERHSAFAHLKQYIGKVELFADARFSTQETNSRVDRRFPGDIVVSGDDPATPEIEGNPFFVDPTGTGLTTVRVDNYSFENDLPFLQLGEIDSFGADLGLRFEIGDNWHGELVGSWSKEESISFTLNSLDRDALNAAVNQTDPNLAFNPFGDGPSTNPAVLESIVGPGAPTLSNDSEFLTFGAHFTGDAFNIAGGAVQVATGIEAREEKHLSVIASTSAPTSAGNRDVTAIYGEVFFPLVGKDNSRPGLRLLELSLAGRYEDYSDFGDSGINPKLGLVWSPIQALTIRGTWGTSFRAPSLPDLDVINGTRVGYVPGSASFVPFSIIDVFGANAELQPEEATTWTVGFEWSPERIENLSLDMTYFNIDFDNRIGSPTNSLRTATSDPRFAPFFNTNPTMEQIIALANDPNWNDAGGAFPAADVISGALPVLGITDLRTTNISRSVVTGLEFQLAYAFETAVGAFNMGLNGSYLFDFERQLIEADPLSDEVDTYGRPVDFRARGNVTWSREGWSVSGFVNYIDSYTDNVNDDPSREIDSWTTVDLTITYQIGENSGFLSDTRFSLSTQNLFDEDPPFVNSRGGLAYDSVNANPLGRFLSFHVNKEW